MILTETGIQQNKERFISIVNSISREGFNKDLLLNDLENSDWYYAPATTKYHDSFKGGLVNHSLKVYDNMSFIVNKYNSNMWECNPDSIKIVSLFHDISKMNYYEIYYRNQKVYSEYGSKVDDGGRYDWKQVAEYKTRDIQERFIYCNHEVTSEFIIRQYMPLSTEESIAILHHHGGTSEDSIKDTVPSIYSRYPLALLLHVSDMISSYL